MTLMVTPTKSSDTLEHSVLARLFSDLSGGAIAYAVLRNHEHLPFSVGARDIDVVVRPDHLRKAIVIVVKLAKDFNLRFANHYADERMTQITLMRRLNEGMFDLKIDFFTSSQALGIELLSAGDMLTDLRFHNGIPVVSEMVLLLDKFLFHLVVGKPVHPKYDARFGRIVRGHQQGLERYLVSLLGRREAERLIRAMATDAASALEPLTPFKRLGLWLALSRRQRTGRLSLMARFLWQRIRNRVRPHGLLLSVSGPDGSGKTTVIDLALAELRQLYGENGVRYHHFRPTVLPRIAEMAKAGGALDKVDADYAQPHRAAPSGFAGSLVRLGYYAMDYLVGYVRLVHPALKDRRIVLFDRYYHDMICDPGRSRIRLPDWCLRAVGRVLSLPRFSFFIRVAPEVARRRKQELSVEQISDLNRRYGDLVRRGWMIQVENEGPPELAARAIVDRVVDHYGAAARRTLTEASS